MTMTASRTLLIDARCLQHPGYATRGIGRHIETMLRAAPAAVCRDFMITALIDPVLPRLAPPVATLFDNFTTTAYAACHRAGSVFLNPAPLAFSPLPVGGLLRAPGGVAESSSIAERWRKDDEGITCIAVVLDFIPLDFPKLYLTMPERRRQYMANLAALRRYDRFLPISRASAARLEQIVSGKAKQSTVTGVAIRASLLPENGVATLPFASRRPEIFIVAGDDPRKNPELAVRAHAASTALRAAAIRLRFAAIHDPDTRARLEALHRAGGGDPALLEFAPVLDEAALAQAYARALLVVAPSRTEGFSLPIIEAMAQGTPVLATDEPAQAELVTDAASRFGADDDDVLRSAMESLSLDPSLWQKTAVRQAGIWRNFTPEAVAARFWQPFLNLPAPAIIRRAKPRIALLSPLPPAPSGCADHSAALLTALAPDAEVTAFTETPAPALPAGIIHGGRADPQVMRSRRFDAVIGVIGNTPLHRTEARLLRDHGGAAIVHDARLGGLYRSGFGDTAALSLAIAEHGAPVTYEQLDVWETDHAATPLRFLGEIAAAAAPMIVHAASTAQWIAAHHGIAPRFLPFPPYRLPDPASLTAAGRLAARRRLGIAPESKLVVSFGYIQRDKAPETLIRTAAVLRRSMAFNMAFNMALAGAAGPGLAVSLRALATLSGFDERNLILHHDMVSESVYRDYLAAADCAIQLRSAPQGSISGALMDAIAAGLPAVASATLAEAITAPSYVYPVPDDAGPEDIALMVQQAIVPARAAALLARNQFLAGRNMRRYAAQLLQAVLH
jgi:glycosyltransferase involved in cell wall biosynthesis